eukprot:COSAG02_NODE_756_length_17532_cov_5.673550_13_plen_131_part_00
MREWLLDDFDADSRFAFGAPRRQARAPARAAADREVPAGRITQRDVRDVGRLGHTCRIPGYVRMLLLKMWLMLLTALPVTLVGAVGGVQQPKRWVSYWYDPADTVYHERTRPGHNVTTTLSMPARRSAGK